MVDNYMFKNCSLMISMMGGDKMNSYQNIGMYFYHTCAIAPEYFGREYYCIDHIGVKSIPYIKLHLY